MKKTKFLAIPVLAALVLGGCGSTEAVTNKAPSVVGVKDIQCMVNSTVDFLDGVAALDKEDGDITPELEITVTPQVEVNDGYAYFSEVGEYTVTYKITDSNGRTAQKRAYVDVVDRETYKTFAMPEGFSVYSDGLAKIEKCGMENGAFNLKATGGEIAEDIKLTRSYTMTCDVQYTFHYTVNSDVAGKIKVMADGDECAEIAVSVGENELTFAHTARKIEEEAEREVAIDICLGSLGNVNWVIEGVECEYPQEAGKKVERAVDFAFGGRVLPRIESTARGNAYADLNENFACLEIDETCNDIWLGGMFINTEIAMKAGVTYTISFNVVGEPRNEDGEPNYFQIRLINKQWDEKQIGDTFETPSGKVETTVTISDQNAGSLWLYVQSGTFKNRIKVSDLSVLEHLNAVGKDTFAIEDFTEFHDANYNSVMTTDRGSFTYEIEKFSSVDNHHTITSPSFMVAGSCSNYVITFKAKASAPIDMVVAGPVYGGWDPTMMWAKVNLSEEERVYTFRCNGLGADRLYTIVWQFGSGANQQYKDVKIEISDIRISLKNGELDG